MEEDAAWELVQVVFCLELIQPHAYGCGAVKALVRDGNWASFFLLPQHMDKERRSLVSLSVWGVWYQIRIGKTVEGSIAFADQHCHHRWLYLFPTFLQRVWNGLQNFMPTKTVERSGEGQRKNLRSGQYEHVEIDRKTGRSVYTWIGDKFMSSNLFVFEQFCSTFI